MAKFRSWTDANVISNTAFIHKPGRKIRVYHNITQSSRERIYRWRHADYDEWQQTQRDLIGWARGG